ncbi:UNVERIFIED_CONTAM: hypothetical protein K2H54_049597 [Gekko kuhli]
MKPEFVDMRNWHLEEMDGTDIPISFNPSSNSVVADVQELPPSVQNLYWVAPPSYLGEKCLEMLPTVFTTIHKRVFQLSSYGGYLSYQVKTFGLPSEGMTLLEKRPDVLLMGKQLKIIYVDPNSPSPGRQYYGSVRLVERRNLTRKDGIPLHDTSPLEKLSSLLAHCLVEEGRKRDLQKAGNVTWYHD